MKALVLTAYNRFELLEQSTPAIGPDDVLLRVSACGICGSDVHGMDGSTGRRQPPIIMGHEAAGTIAQLGSNVAGWAEGDRVTFDSTVNCGRCWFCRRGQINLCDNRQILGVSCDECRRDGAFAEYVAVPQHILYRLPDGLSFRHAAMVEPVAVAVHAVGRSGVRLGDTAVVVGAGVIGLFLVQALRAAGCGRIIAVDLDQTKLDLACKLGADEGLRPDQADIAAEIMQRSGGRGADVAFEAVGITPTVQLAAACLRKGGQLTLVGLLAKSVPLSMQTIITRELTVNTSYISCGEYPACLDLIARRAIDVEPLMSAVAPLADGPAWFQRLHAGNEGLIKVILEP
jgi:L-iditol 2-dehydrogenase